MHPRPTRAFTLVELLVVSTLIVILVALLSPALDKAVYEAELVTCAAQLKGWGGMAHQFAMDRKRSLPMAFGPNSAVSDAWGTSPQTARVLDRINAVAEHDRDGRWKTYGTPWSTWRQYGMSDKAGVCPIWRASGNGPSNTSYFDDPNARAPRYVGDLTGDSSSGTLNSQWGSHIWIGYQWIGGTDATVEQQGWNEFHWKSRKPASKLSNATADSVLASDLLYMNYGWANPPNNYRAIGHPTVANLAQPDSMTILFADSRVNIERQEFFGRDPQHFGNTGTPAADEISYRGGASYYWWGK